MPPKRGPKVGSGGQRRRGLEGRGPTPPAAQRPGHPAQRRAAAAARRSDRGERPDRGGEAEVVVGRNAVVEALRAGVPASALSVALGAEADPRLTEAIRLAAAADVPLLEVPKTQLDRLAGGTLHQGVALRVPAYDYAHPDEVLRRTLDAAAVPLIVALDGVTDPRNLGAVVRSAAAFGAQAVVVPERRAAGVTAAAWRTSAGAVARVPVARATNLVRTLTAYGKEGLLVVGLAADGSLELPELEAAVDPLVLVVGSEGRGLSRLVAQTCDLVVSIPMTAGTESLNAGVAAGVALYEIARRRRGMSRL